MSEEQDRLTRVETEVSYLKNSFTKVETAITQLAEDMHQLALAEAKRAEDRQALERIFKQFESIQGEFTRLWQRTDQMIEKEATNEKDRLEKELNESKKWLGEIGKTAGAILLAILLAHYGIKML